MMTQLSPCAYQGYIDAIAYTNSGTCQYPQHTQPVDKKKEVSQEDKDKLEKKKKVKDLIASYYKIK